MTPPRLAARLAALIASGAALRALSALGCRPLPPPAPAPSAPAAPASQRSVILVTIDGVRPREVFEGVEEQRALAAGMERPAITSAEALLPGLHRLVRERGALVGKPGLGPPVMASGPVFVSQPGYLEMSTGTAAHGCSDNRCPLTEAMTWLDRCVEAGDRDAAVVAGWERIELIASSRPGSLALSAGRSAGPTRARLAFDDENARLLALGEASDPYPGEHDYRLDAVSAPLGLRYLEKHHPRCFWLALGDTDEWAHRDNYPGYLQALRDFDRTLTEIAAILDRGGEWGRQTLVLVATDHSRELAFKNHGKSPDAGPVFLATFGASMPGRGVIAPASERHLADVAPTLLAFLGLPPLPGGGTGQVAAELLPGP